VTKQLKRHKKKRLVPSRTASKKEMIYFNHLRDELGLGSSVKLLPETYRVRIPLKTGVVLSYLPSMVVLDEEGGHVAYHIAKESEAWSNRFDLIKDELAGIGFDLIWVSDDEFPFGDYE